jgi:hypothetical protein
MISGAFALRNAARGGEGKRSAPPRRDCIACHAPWKQMVPSNGSLPRSNFEIGVKDLVGIVLEEDDGTRTTSSPETTK